MPVLNLHTGVDIIEIARVRQAVDRYGSRFLNRVYTQRELEEVGGNIASLAARFAAKEAVSKALGTGIGHIQWHEIEVLRGPDREPTLCLHGAAQRLSEARNLQAWSLSLSHTHEHAIAFVVAMGDN